MRDFISRSKALLSRTRARRRYWANERRYWDGQMRAWYRERYDLELDPIQTDESRVPSPGLTRKIQPGGRANPVAFVASGQRLVMTYLRDLDEHGFDPRAFERILDFGVGFGRLVRHYYPFRAELHGCDVTAVAAEFSKRCYGGRVAIVENDLAPPLPYGTGSFDYIYANSVFTHIQTDALASWIAELARVARPGACVIVSVFSALPYLAHLTEGEFDRIERGAGYLEWGTSHVRQRLLFATGEKLREWWSPSFEILDQKGHFKDQDHLILRRPG